MARAVMTIADSQQAAEQQIRDQAPAVRVLWSRQIDLGGIPPLASGPLAEHWAVVVEQVDADREAELVRDAGLDTGDDPAEVCERQVRLMYMQMATDPDLLVTGTTEEFPCPSCGERTTAHLAAPREVRYPEHATCVECGTHLGRASRSEQWQVKAQGQKPRCVFCGGPGNSHEHVIPRWIAKRLDIRGFLPAEDVLIYSSERRHQPISFANYRARIMCADCNEHFKHLEDAALPVVLAMARGWGLALDEPTQLLLSRWVNKTAIALTAAVPDLQQLVPEEHALAVRHGGVADDTWIGLFPWRGSPVVGGGRVVVEDPVTGAERSGYCALLAFREFGFYCIGLDERRANEVLEAEKPPLLQLWPTVRRQLTWPPSGHIDKASVRELFRIGPLRTEGSKEQAA